MVPEYLTIAEAARLIESRELSPVELTRQPARAHLAARRPA